MPPYSPPHAFPFASFPILRTQISVFFPFPFYTSSTHESTHESVCRLQMDRQQELILQVKLKHHIWPDGSLNSVVGHVHCWPCLLGPVALLVLDLGFVCLWHPPTHVPVGTVKILIWTLFVSYTPRHVPVSIVKTRIQLASVSSLWLSPNRKMSPSVHPTIDLSCLPLRPPQPTIFTHRPRSSSEISILGDTGLSLRMEVGSSSSTSQQTQDRVPCANIKQVNEDSVNCGNYANLQCGKCHLVHV